MTYEQVIKQIRETAAEEGATSEVRRAAEDAVLAYILRRKYLFT